MLEEVVNTPDGIAALVAQVQADPMVVFRCAENISRTGEMPSADFNEACRRALPEIQKLSPAQVTAGIESSLMHREVHLALEWLREVGVLEMFLPELTATVDLAQEAGRKHKDVWEHTKQVVRQSVPRPAVRWGALLHDIGKVPTRTFTSDGKVHFHGHAEVGARMFNRQVARRFAFDADMRAQIHYLILHHLRASQYDPNWTDSAIRRFGKEMGPGIVDLLDLSRADITSKRPGRRQFLLTRIKELSDRIDAVEKEDARVPPLRKGIGTAITEKLGIPPSRRIGELKLLMEQAIASGELEARQEDDYYLDWLKAQGHV